MRIITADLTVTCADGTRYTATYRLATTLCDPRHYPARRLIAVYHQRWEHEIAYLALRHPLREGFSGLLRELGVGFGSFTLLLIATEGVGDVSPAIAWSLVCGALGSAIVALRGGVRVISPAVSEGR